MQLMRVEKEESLRNIGETRGRIVEGMEEVKGIFEKRHEKK